MPDAPARDPFEEACEVNDAAVVAFHAGRTEEAVGLFHRALQLLVCKFNGRFEEAEPLYQRALALLVIAHP